MCSNAQHRSWNDAKKSLRPGEGVDDATLEKFCELSNNTTRRRSMEGRNREAEGSFQTKDGVYESIQVESGYHRECSELFRQNFKETFTMNSIPPD